MSSSTQPLAPRRALDPRRLALALTLLGTAAATVAFSHGLRVQEARLAAPLVDTVTGRRALSVPDQPEIMAGLGTTWATMLHVSVMCSAAVLFVPVLVVAAAIAPARQINPVRLVAALAACGLAILATNTLRIIAIAASMEHWGPSRGYVLAHDSLGSLISLIGVGIGLLLFVRLTVGRIDRLSRIDRLGRRH